MPLRLDRLCITAEPVICGRRAKPHASARGKTLRHHLATFLFPFRPPHKNSLDFSPNPSWMGSGTNTSQQLNKGNPTLNLVTHRHVTSPTTCPLSRRRKTISVLYFTVKRRPSQLTFDLVLLQAEQSLLVFAHDADISCLVSVYTPPPPRVHPHVCVH